jgi:hypothetical protein
MALFSRSQKSGSKYYINYRTGLEFVLSKLLRMKKDGANSKKN